MPSARTLYSQCSLLILLGLAASLNFCAAAQADDTDPFQIDSGHWMSFDHYNDNIKRKRPVGNEALDAAPKIETPALVAPAPDAQAAATPAATEQALSSVPTVAAPTRPLDFPVLPGLNKGFDLQVDSTSDINTSSHAQIVEKDNGESDIHLKQQDWQDAAEMARQKADALAKANSENERLPLDIRMSFLPNPRITPEPSPERKPRPRLAEVPAKPKVMATETAVKAPAECAAIDAYKKKQLEAIQSDRQTLQALQSAIKDLGLQKQLNFMTSAPSGATMTTSVSKPSDSSTVGQP